jgi:hypothetical protein
MTIRKAIVWLTIAKNLGLNLHRLRNYTQARFLTDRQTLLLLKEKDVGITRFGDGELSYLSGYSFPHQKQNPDLRKKLMSILTGYDKSCLFLVALPHDIFFNAHQARNLPPSAWHSAKYSLMPLINKGQVYGSAFCFRMMTVLDEDKKEYAKLLFSLFEGRDLIFVGGGEPFPGLIQIKTFIQTPRANAFDEYYKLLADIQDQAKSLNNPRVLLSCGITATALSVELNAMGIPAYDVGLCFTKRLAPFV